MSGALVWITGLPGAGKTTLSLALWDELRRRGVPAVRLDGDLFRAVMGNDLGYSTGDRLANARRLARMCRLLVEQDLTVVCATVSLFHECHAFNRATGGRYVEVLVRAREDTLHARDQKGLYTAGRAGAEPHALGVNQGFELPESPHVVIDNDGAREALAAAAAELAARVTGA